MSIDPKSLNAIRLVRDKTSGTSHVLAGPIKPLWLSRALPKYGKHRGAIDHVIENVLITIIDAYRVNGKNVNPFWKGPAYQINRKDMAKRFGCRLRGISTALVFLERLKLVTIFRPARYQDGEPRGRMVYAIPNVDRIELLLVEAEKRATLLNESSGCDSIEDIGQAEASDSVTPGREVRLSARSKSGTQADEQKHHILNVPKQRNDDVGHATRQVVPHPDSSLRHLPGRVTGVGGAGGAGDADDTGSTSPRGIQNGHAASGHPKNDPSRKLALLDAHVDHFLYFWEEAGRRTGHLPIVAINPGDRAVVRKFLTANKAHSAWIAAAAILAWQVGDTAKRKNGFDPAWACRQCKDVRTFLHLFSKGLSEIGSAGYCVNAYKNLRWWFTDSELAKHGVKTDVGLNVLDPADCWENDPDAFQYYKNHDLEPPPEVSAAAA